ncbi:MAG: DUF4307 domain-containing protein [Arachnia sp.]
MTADEARIKARYPRRRPADYLVGGIGTVAVLGAIVLVAIQGLEQSNPPVVATVRSFTVTAPTEVSTEIVVQRRNPAEAAVCRLTAQAQSFEVVGEADVDIPPGTEKVTPLTTTVKTVREATSIEVDSCRALP